ncbi:MAG TPA: hypothetical protein VE860_07175 [Chthoniobacterales bacterium]|nr:hypothetical protein [Chthoniobacterales bacterium]
MKPLYQCLHIRNTMYKDIKIIVRLTAFVSAVARGVVPLFAQNSDNEQPRDMQRRTRWSASLPAPAAQRLGGMVLGQR